mmetsp:Transcript_111631/g.360349  ORF Transcript_111631/g.360349 Transcript_111631/m.360349 type:complete len:143 (+) Transcript_111631:72-500(+)
MSGKKCDKCAQPYAGFGTTCGGCRKTRGQAGAASAASQPAGGACVACGKTAYAMERIQVEGQTFHPTCFRCKHCGNKLSPGAFSKSDDGSYYCKVHFEQLFKLRGRYSLAASSVAAAAAAGAGEPAKVAEADEGASLVACSA